MLACVQTSPLPQKKSGEETSPDFSLFSPFYLREGGSLYIRYDHASLYLYYAFNFVAFFFPLAFQKKQRNKQKQKTKRLISKRSQAVSYITQVALFFYLQCHLFSVKYQRQPFLSDSKILSHLLIYHGNDTSNNAI